MTYPHYKIKNVSYHSFQMSYKFRKLFIKNLGIYKLSYFNPTAIFYINLPIKEKYLCLGFFEFETVFHIYTI